MKAIKYLAASLVMAAAIPAQNLVVPARAPANAQVFLLFSFARAAAPVEFSGIGGRLWVDPRSLILVPGAAAQSGFSFTTIPGVPFLAPDALKMQTLTLSAHEATFGSVVREPLHERLIDNVEKTLPSLGPGGSSGPLLFGLSETQVLDTARHYRQGQIDLPKLMRQMARPLGFATAGDLAERIGVENSCHVMHLAWELMLQRVPQALLKQRLNAEIEKRADLYFSAKFPSGVPAAHEYWGDEIETMTPSATSSKTATVEHYPYRLKVSVSAFDYGGTGYGSCEAKLQKWVVAGYVKQEADWIKVDGDLCGSPCWPLYDIDYDDNDAEDSTSATDGGYTVTVKGSAERKGITLSKSVSCKA